MIEAEADSDPVNVPPGELEAVALDAISQSSPPDLDAADETEYEPVVAYCDRSALDLHARLRVFQSLCRAVHGAHQRGTIFGDLSPSRLRATAEGTGVIVASSADDPGEAVSIEPCTSPEQVLGEPATTASDVYALGVVFYELLTGRYPYQVDVGDPDALAKAISEESAERPSAAVARTSGRPDETGDAAAGARSTTRQKLRAALAGDLDLIALKALHKEPERRYASADALADDLDCYFQGLPARAHAPSELYRVGKFLQRRRWVGVVGASLIAAIVVAGALGVRAVSTARRERDRAERLYLSARASVHDVYMRLAEDRPRDSEDVAGLRRDLLDGVARYYEDFNTANSAEPDAAADVAEARTRSAMIARAMGLKKEAEARLREASDLWRRLIAASPAEDAYRERLAKVQAELGRSLDAGGKTDSQPDEALAAFESARSLLTPVVDAHPDARPLRRELARLLRDEADIHDRRDRPGPANDLLRRSIRLQEELVWENPHDLDARLALASAYGFMARVDARRESGRSGARAALERAIEVLNEAPEAGAADAPPRLAFETAQRLIDLANVERSVDATREAAGHATRATAILESLTARHPTDLVYQEELAAAYNVVGELLRNQGAFTPALEAARKARGALDRLLIEQPKNPSYPIELSTVHQLIGRVLAQSGKYADAIQSFQRAVDLLEGRPDLDATSQYNLASTLSLALSLVGAKDGSPPPDDDEKLSAADKLRRRLYADRAVVALRQAVAKGFNQLDVYRTDPALDPLRSRDDFQKILADLAAEKP
ncbi:hypothetical protein [Paludisphaera borealis]|uniref:Serine/threonine-protein kinase PknB n=1 Tax=Paludisphaera borealis TaxID=1387353 RepID=A0A1U7CIL8_9BACT|nr:hypothetical protein [Paludisphaera borealis]APW58785.1 Serine/threonine-protein kinase PknB [Paludisphaera borealis]